MPKTPAKKTAASRAPAKKGTPAAKKKATPTKKQAPAKKQPVAKKQATAKKQPATKKTSPAKKAPAKKAAPARKKAAAPAPAKKAAPSATSTAKKAAAAPIKKKAAPVAPPRPVVKKKVVFDKFMLEQKEQLETERADYVAQAEALKAEADALAQEMDPSDVQFDEESGEGGTANIDRERDLILSAQARLAVEEIDQALARLNNGTYGICERCGQHIPRPRLKAIPHASLCVACKSGGLSRR
jgi:DnaK suppressor protein